MAVRAKPGHLKLGPLGRQPARYLYHGTRFTLSHCASSLTDARVTMQVSFISVFAPDEAGD